MQITVELVEITESREWLTRWLTDLVLWEWQTDWLILWQPHVPRPLVTDCLPETVIGYLTDWYSGWLTDWLRDWLTYWLIISLGESTGFTDWLTDRLSVWQTDWMNWLSESGIDKLTDPVSILYLCHAWLGLTGEFYYSSQNNCKKFELKIGLVWQTWVLVTMVTPSF